MASTRTSFANVIRSSLSRNDTRRSGGRRRTEKHVVGGRTVGKAHGRGRRVSRVSGTDQAEVDMRMDMEAMIAAEVVSGDSDGSPGELFVLPPDRVEYFRREIPARLRQNRLCVTSDEGEGLEGDEEGESCSIENRESCVNAEEEEDEMWSNEQLMSFLVRHAADEHARPPISRFHVGAAGLGESGTIYLGVNVELHGTTLGQSIHGEQFLIANAFAHGETRLEMLVVNELPCGHCRQFIAEMEGGLDMAVVVPSKEVNVAAGSLLPYAFTPDQIQEHPTQYMFSGRVVDGLVLEDDVRLKSDATAMAALAAAQKSYCPYSKCPSGVAVRLTCGSVIAGSYLESAAYNPSLPPLQAAFVNLIIAGKGPIGHYADEWKTIEEVVLVEMKDVAVKQEHVTRAAIGAVAPDATVRVLHAKYT